MRILLLWLVLASSLVPALASADEDEPSDEDDDPFDEDEDDGWVAPAEERAEFSPWLLHRPLLETKRIHNGFGAMFTGIAIGTFVPSMVMVFRGLSTDVDLMSAGAMLALTASASSFAFAVMNFHVAATAGKVERGKVLGRFDGDASAYYSGRWVAGQMLAQAGLTTSLLGLATLAGLGGSGARLGADQLVQLLVIGSIAAGVNAGIGIPALILGSTWKGRAEDELGLAMVVPWSDGRSGGVAIAGVF